MHSNPKKGTTKSVNLDHTTGETELKQLTGNMQNLLDSYPGSLYSIDRNYRYTVYNRAHELIMLEVYGAQIKPNTSPLDYITFPEYHEMAKQKLDQALIGGEPFTDQEYSIDKAGSKSFFNVHYMPIKDENSVVTGISVFAEDVTELRKSNDIRKETEELYGNLFRDISSIILVIDVETKSILNANQAACDFYGYTQAELVALKISDLAVLSAEELHNRIQKVANGEANHFQHAHRLANGEVREVDIYAGAVKFNGRQVNVAVVHDISARKAAEDALKLSEERYKAQFKNLPVPTFTWQHKGDDFVLIDYNDSANIITEGQGAKLMGKSASELYKDDPEVLADLSKCFNEQSTIHHEIKIRLRSTGVVRDFIVTYVYIPSDLVQVYTEDITQHKIDEEKLRASETRLREVLENVQDAPYRRNLQTDRYDYISPSIEQISGFTAEETISMPTEAVLAHMHTDDLANIEQTILDSIANPGKPYQIEYRFKHKRTNQYRWLQDHFTTMLDAQGRPMFRYGTVRNITEHKLAEDKLRDSEERYRLVVENSYDAILLAAPDGSVLNANPAAARMFGMTEEEIIQAGRSKLVDINDPAFTTAINDHDRNGKYTGVLTHIRKDGSTFPAEFSSTLFQDKDGNPRASVIIRDITERIQVEEAKQEAEARYRGLFEQSHDAIFILDLQGRHITANQRAADMMGYSLEELHGLSVREASAELQQSLQVIQQLLSGEHVTHYERLFQKKDGTIFPVEINVELVRDSHGNPLHIQSIVRDITERKEAEKKLRESEERWKFALEGAGNGVWDWNISTNKVFFSNQWKSMLGHADDEIGDSLDEWQKRVHPDDLSETLDKVNKHLEGKSPYYISEHRVLCKDGSYKWIIDRGKVVEWAVDKKPLRIIGTHQDISERKTAEEKLRESEERFRLLFENSQAVMGIIDPESGEILDANPAAATFYGYSLEQLRGMSIDKINALPPETVYTERQHALREERNFFVFPHRLASGEMRTVEVHSSPVQMKGRQVLFSIIHDITKRKIAEEKLIESEERFSTAFHSSQEAISITRFSDGVYIDVNDVVLLHF